MKKRNIKLAVLGLLLSCTSIKAQTIEFQRITDAPIIYPELLPAEEGSNINGPSLIRTPDWLPNSLGKYYLYFAHHHGDKIRLAYADELISGWKVYEAGALKLSDCETCIGHLASPDVFVDNERKEIVLYFHAPINNERPSTQVSFRAVSKDGINFAIAPTVLGDSYFRVFEWNGNHYAIARAGELYRSTDGGHTFEHGPNPFRDIQNEENYLRHAAVKVDGNKLYVFYSRIGDTPESIVVSTIDLNSDWKQWKASQPVLVAKPEAPFEGADKPLERSRMGSVFGAVNQLRDPAFYEEDGKWYLLYSVAGENGIGIAEIKVK